MRYSIITATLLRPELERLCDSIDAQTFTDWQHIVVVDTLSRPKDLLRAIDHPRRKLVFCDRAHNDWAATCRRSAWEHAQGQRLLYIDDDNYYADPDVLDTLTVARRPVVLFPILYKGEVSEPLPIMPGRSDSNGLMVERSIGQWPMDRRRNGDGWFVQHLTEAYQHEVLDCRPLVVFETDNFGR